MPDCITRAPSPGVVKSPTGALVSGVRVMVVAGEMSPAPLVVRTVRVAATALPDQVRFLVAGSPDTVPELYVQPVAGESVP